MRKIDTNLRHVRAAILMLLLSGVNSNLGAFAANSPQPQEITGSNGDLFMEETAAPQIQKQRSSTHINVINGRNSSTSDSTSPPRSTDRNGILMQEVDTTPKQKPRRAYVDLSNVGIQVDPSGNMIPTIDHSGNSVRPLGSNTHVYNEMPVPTINSTYDNPFALPYTMDGQPAAVGTTFVPVTPGTVPFLQPSFNPYNGITTLNPYSARPYVPGFGGYGGYGGYPSFPGNGFYPGYPGGGTGFNIGKLHIGVGQPGFGGYPGPGFGYPRYGYNGFGGSGYGVPGYGGGFGGYNSGGGLLGNGIGLPMPTNSTYTTSSSSSSLVTPVLRDPATSTGDLLEDAKRSGLWSNTAGSGSGFFNRGLIGGSYGGSGEQHDTGVTQGSGLK
jgi:hypothetical protein